MFLNARIISVLAILLMISPAIRVLGGTGSVEPPGSGEQIIGPPIDGVLTAIYAPETATTSGTSSIVIVGSCKKTPVAFVFPPQPVTLAEFQSTTVDDIHNQRQRGVAPPGCFSALGGEDLIITGVSKFNNTGTEIGADIQISVVRQK